MKFKYIFSLLCVISCCLCATLSAQVYKWVDENGKVHYSDKPFNKDARPLDLKSNVSPEQEAKARAEAQARVERIKKLVTVELDDKQQSRQEAAKNEYNQKRLSAACKRGHQELSMLQQQIRIAETGKDGELNFLSDEDRKNEIAKLKEVLGQHCSDIE